MTDTGVVDVELAPKPTPLPPKPKTLGDIIPALEEMLAWAKAHPDLPAPWQTRMCFNLSGESETKATVREIAKALPNSRKYYANDYFSLTHEFCSGVMVEVLTARNAVCVRKVVGTREVPQQIIPAHTAEIVEWDCKPILEEGN